MPKAITQFDEIYAVGDSMSDNGGIYHLSSEALALVVAAFDSTLGLQPVPIPPYDQRFSNGPVLPEYTAELLGATLHDFAFGAAPAVGSLTFGDLAQTVIPPAVLAAIRTVPGVQEIFDHNISLTGQLLDLTAALTANPPAKDSALVSLIGLNDFLALAGSFNPNDPNSAAIIAAAVQQLIPDVIAANHIAATTAFSLGIDTVIYETLPAASFFPVSTRSHLTSSCWAIRPSTPSMPDWWPMRKRCNSRALTFASFTLTGWPTRSPPIPAPLAS